MIDDESATFKNLKRGENRMAKLNQAKKYLLTGLLTALIPAVVIAGVFTSDLSIDVTDNVTSANSGETVTYVITVANAGPDDANSVRVTDSFPPVLSCSTTCVASGTSSCAAGPVVGDLDDMSASLVVGDTLTYTSVCLIDVAFGDATLSNTATVTPNTVAIADPDALNNTSTDDDTLVGPADLIFRTGHDIFIP